jgi:hypothetical protein
MKADNKHREAARSTMPFNRNWPIGADTAGNSFALDSATPDAQRKTLSVKTYVMTDIIAQTAEQIGFNDPAARDYSSHNFCNFHDIARHTSINYNIPSTP